LHILVNHVKKLGKMNMWWTSFISKGQIVKNETAM